jgi:hypothetical protein
MSMRDTFAEPMLSEAADLWNSVDFGQKRRVFFSPMVFRTMECRLEPHQAACFSTT